jgi:carboxymethylenebutenolidase
MNRMTAKDFDQELLDLYDFYAHGKISKREFLDKAGKFAVGGVTAMALSPICSDPGACATIDTARGEIRLFNWQN